MDVSLIKDYLAEIGLFGVIALYIFHYVNELRKEKPANSNAENFAEFNQSLLTRVSKLEEKVQDLQDGNAQLKIENEKLRTRLLIMESAHQDAPIPMWLKDARGVMLSLNSAYEAEFLLPVEKTADDYIGHSDFEVWGPEIAAEYGTNDAWVANTRSMWLGTESVLLKDGSTVQYAIMKYPRLEGNFLIGIAGIAIPKALLDQVDFSKEEAAR